MLSDNLVSSSPFTDENQFREMNYLLRSSLNRICVLLKSSPSSLVVCRGRCGSVPPPVGVTCCDFEGGVVVITLPHF